MGLGALGLASSAALRVGIADHQREPPRIGRPFVALQVALHVGKLRGFAAGPVEQPDLAAFGLSRPRREERQVFIVGTPARRVLVLGAGRHPEVATAVDADHPDVGIVFVLLGVGGGHRVSHPLAVGRALRVADVAKTVEVVERERMARRLGEEDGGAEKG